MDFYLNIGTLTRGINEYKNKRKLVGEEKDYIVSSVNLFTASGWSGESKDKFVDTFITQMSIYEKFEKDLDEMINALEEEKRRALLLKARCEDFVNCIKGCGQGGGFTGEDEGIISLDYSSQGSINNFVSNCTNEDYTRLTRNFNEIQNILSELEYTSFGISSDVDHMRTSVNNQTESLTEFNDSYNMYYAGVKDMESNICSMFSKISGINADMFKQSNVILPSGDIDKNKIRDVMLKSENGLTEEDKSVLNCLEKILGNEEYNNYKAAILKNPEDLTDDEKKMLDRVKNVFDYDLSLKNRDEVMKEIELAKTQINDIMLKGEKVLSDTANTVMDIMFKNPDDLTDEDVESIDEEDDVLAPIEIQTTDGAAVTYHTDLSVEDDENDSNFFDNIKTMAGDFTSGLAYSTSDNISHGYMTYSKGIDDNDLPHTGSYKVGKIVGDLGSLFGRGIEGGIAGGAEIGGISLDATGVGAIPGVSLNAAGAAIGIDAAAGAYQAANNFGNDIMNLMSGDGGSSSNIKDVYDSIKKAPQYPEGFKAKLGGSSKNNIKNKEVLDELRKVESGEWKKVYKDGCDVNGKKISIHYFQSKSGKVFNVKVKNGWSNS